MKPIEIAIVVANKVFTGHFTLMKFTTNYKFCFGTPIDRDDIDKMFTGKTQDEAIQNALMGYLGSILKQEIEEKKSCL